MSPKTRLSIAMLHIGWGATGLAEQVGVNERTVRRWISGDNPPPEPILEWLEGLAAFHQADPPPQRKELT